MRLCHFYTFILKLWWLTKVFSMGKFIPKTGAPTGIGARDPSVNPKPVANRHGEVL